MADNSQQLAEQAKSEVKKIMAEMQIKPQLIVQLGNMAESVFKDKALYPVFREQAIKSGAAEEDDLPTKPDPHLLATFAALGKMANQMMQSGELTGV
jgi:hypothetical protein